MAGGRVVCELSGCSLNDEVGAWRLHFRDRSFRDAIGKHPTSTRLQLDDHFTTTPLSTPNHPLLLSAHALNMAMDTDTIPNLLGDARDQAPEELQEYFIAFEDYWERKLWHELTDKLVEFFEHSESAKQRIPFFETFIKSFANKINQLKLVTLGLSAATQFKGGL